MNFRPRRYIVGNFYRRAAMLTSNERHPGSGLFERVSARLGIARSKLLYLTLGVSVLIASSLLVNVADRPGLDLKRPQPAAKSFRDASAGTSYGASGDAESSMASEILAALAGKNKVYDEASIRGLIAQLLDKTAPLKLRRRAAWELARAGSDQAIAALKEALADGPPYLKAAIAEGLGYSPHPEAKKIIVALLNDKDEVAARGAVRGLAAIGDGDAVGHLSKILLAPGRTESLRGEAAEALGEIDAPEAFQSLVRALTQVKNDDLARDVLAGLGKLPWEKTERLFSAYLESPQIPSERRAAALEALQYAEGDPHPFLLKYVRDQDPEVRAAAAWAIAAAMQPGDAGNELVSVLGEEADPEVRRRIYQALENQEGVVDRATLMPMILGETDRAARLAGFDLLASYSKQSDDPAVRSRFDKLIVPELRQMALSDRDPDMRAGAYMALRRAKTPEALKAADAVKAQIESQEIVQSAKSPMQSKRKER